MNMAKYSFIIPVYNVEKYLQECIDSILCQSFTDYSIILVDDGSTDKSGAICDMYAEKYSIISVIHKKNGGLSSARNAGLKVSQSKYIIYVDSDDYWNNSEGLKNIDHIIGDQDVDILCFSSQNYYEESGKREDDRYNYPTNMNQMAPVDSFKYQITHDLYNLSAAKKVYRRNFLIDNSLFFIDGIKSEDVELGIRMANYLPTYKFYNSKLYTYRHREGSITNTISRKHIQDYIGIIEKYAEYAFKPEISDYVMSYLAYQYALLLTHISVRKFDDKRECLKKLKRFVYLFNYTKYPRVRMISKVYKLLGYDLTRILLSIYFKCGK